MRRAANIIARGIWARGVFPHQFAWLLDNPLRRLLVTPQQLADRLPLRADSHVLEVGPGSGYFSTELAARVPRGLLHLIDRQPEMLVKARGKLEARNLHNVLYTAADAGASLPVPSRRFDIAILVSVLGEVENRSQCLRSLYDVLPPHGVLAIHESFPDPDRIGVEELVTLAEQHGFHFQRRYGHRLNYTALFTRR